MATTNGRTGCRSLSKRGFELDLTLNLTLKLIELIALDTVKIAHYTDDFRSSIRTEKGSL